MARGLGEKNNYLSVDSYLITHIRHHLPMKMKKYRAFAGLGDTLGVSFLKLRHDVLIQVKRGSAMSLPLA